MTTIMHIPGLMILILLAILVHNLIDHGPERKWLSWVLGIVLASIASLLIAMARVNLQ